MVDYVSPSADWLSYVRLWPLGTVERATGISLLLRRLSFPCLGKGMQLFVANLNHCVWLTEYNCLFICLQENKQLFHCVTDRGILSRDERIRCGFVCLCVCINYVYRYVFLEISMCVLDSRFSCTDLRVLSASVLGLRTNHKCLIITSHENIAWKESNFTQCTTQLIRILIKAILSGRWGAFQLKKHRE